MAKNLNLEDAGKIGERLSYEEELSRKAERVILSGYMKMIGNYTNTQKKLFNEVFYCEKIRISQGFIRKKFNSWGGIKMKEKAIQKLIESGMTEREAISEFNDTVNYYLRGTLRTAADRVYAMQCATDEILDDSEEAEEITEHYPAMLDIMYS